MASGSSGRANSGSKGFDFASDDILCSYEDYGNQDSNGNHSDPGIGSNSGKDFQKSRMSRTSIFPAIAYSQSEDSFNQDVIVAVEKTMKKYCDNLMRFLEGISSRLSQLELYCYNLDKSIGEMRSDLARDHGEADLKLKFLEKHLQEVHRSVQILRDKQELADTQKELAKLQLAQKESTSSNNSQSNEEKSSPSAPDSKKVDDNHHLALALPHQVAPQQQPVAPQQQQPVAPQQQLPIAPASQVPPPNVTQQQSYYLPPANPPPSQHPQSEYLPPDPQYRTSQLQDISRMTPQPPQTQVNQASAVQAYPHYQQQQQQQQQWPQQVQPSQQPSMQPQVRPSPATIYPPYAPSQPTNPSLPETLPNSMPMQVPYSGVPQTISSRADSMSYGYGGAARPVPQQPPPQPIKGFGPQTADGYGPAVQHHALPPASAYMMYETDGGRTHHPPQPPHFPQSGYPPTNLSLQTPQPTPGANMMARNPSHSQFFRNHPYNDLIEKFVSMGFRGDQVASVIQRMEESGQPVDFNAVLDRLNVHPSGSSQRGWSG